MIASRLLREVSVEHRALECARPFEAVHKGLIESVPALKPELAEILVRGDQERVATARRDWPKLWIFFVRDHGALTAADGQKSKAMQYEIGNPLTAERMTRHELDQFGDERVAQVGRELNAELETALLAASGA